MAKGTVIIDPVPKGAVYVLNSASGENSKILCSINGGFGYYDEPVMRAVTQPDGKKVEKPAPPEMYSHIKWTIKKPVLPGQTGWVEFKTTVR